MTARKAKTPLTPAEALQVRMVNLAKEFQAGSVTLDAFMEAQGKLAAEITTAKADEAKALVVAARVAREAEAGARELVATEVAIALEGFELFKAATAVVSITPGDSGPLFSCKVTLSDAALKDLDKVVQSAGYGKLAYKPGVELTFNADGIVDAELKVKVAAKAASTSSCKGTWHQGDVGPVSLAKAYETSFDNEAKDATLELDRRIKAGELAKGSYGCESWQIKVAAVKRHGWEKAA